MRLPIAVGSCTVQALKDARFAEFELGSARTSPEPPAATPRAAGVTGVAAKRSELAGV